MSCRVADVISVVALPGAGDGGVAEHRRQRRVVDVSSVVRDVMGDIAIRRGRRVVAVFSGVGGCGVERGGRRVDRDGGVTDGCGSGCGGGGGGGVSHGGGVGNGGSNGGVGGFGVIPLLTWCVSREFHVTG